MAPPISLFDAFKLAGNGPLAHKNCKKAKDCTETDNDQDREKDKNPTKKVPVWLWRPHKKKVFFHYLEDCAGFPEVERKDLQNDYADKKKTCMAE